MCYNVFTNYYELLITKCATMHVGFYIQNSTCMYSGNLKSEIENLACQVLTLLIFQNITGNWFEFPFVIFI
jgi:hypothetical protein